MQLTERKTITYLLLRLSKAVQQVGESGKSWEIVHTPVPSGAKVSRSEDL